MRKTLVIAALGWLTACGTTEPTTAPCTQGTCSQECAGCDQGCAGGGCAQTCQGGMCKLGCTGGDCAQTCESGSDCPASCTGAGCTQICEPGATCTFGCTGGGCTQTCEPGADCTFSCSNAVACDTTGVPDPGTNNPMANNEPSGVTSCTELCGLTGVATTSQGDCVGARLTLKGYPVAQTPACVGFTTVPGCLSCYAQLQAADADCVAAHKACF